MIHKVFDKATGYIGGAASVLMMLVACFTFANVLLRTIFNSPVSGAIEVVQYGMMISAGLILCRTSFNKRHIAVSLLVDALPARIGATVRTVTNLIATAIFTYITYYYFTQIPKMMTVGRTSDVLKFPYWTMYTIMAVCLLFTALVFLYLTGSNFIRIFKPGEDSGKKPKDKEIDVDSQLS